MSVTDLKGYNGRGEKSCARHRGKLKNSGSHGGEYEDGYLLG
jgi:hypothetical protein